MLARPALVVALLTLALAPTPATCSDEDKETEKWLRQTYEKKLVRVYPPPTSLQVQLPSEHSDSITPAMRLYLKVEKVSCKSQTARLEARRVYFYLNANGELKETEEGRQRYELDWTESKGNGLSFRDAISTTLRVTTGEQEDWSGYWPPVPPKEWLAQPLESRDSLELAPDVFALGRDMQAPRCDPCLQPKYPQNARRAGEEGSLSVWALVTETGRVAGIRIEKSAGISFDESFVRALAHWRFKPGLRGGKPVALSHRIQMQFHLY